MATGEVPPDSIRVIFRSEKFPPATLGYAHNLDPELSGKLKAAVLACSWSGTALEKQFAATGVSKWTPISYKDDFALIRRIDAAMESTAMR